MGKKVLFKLLITFLLITGVFSGSLLAKDPVDISNHWAQDYIINVVSNEIMTTKENNKFEPDEPVTRGEFSVALARQLSLLPVHESYYEDLDGYEGREYIHALVEKEIVSGYPDNVFKPDKSLSRVETISMLIKALGIKDEEEIIRFEDYDPYEDIDEEHWAVTEIKIGKKLGIIADNSEEFNPDKLTTRAEAARYLNKLDDLSGESGYITDIYPTSEKVSVNLSSGNREIFNISDDSIFGRNNRLVDIDNILETDKVFIVSDKNKEIKYLKAYGMVTQDDLATEISSITRGVLTPEEVKTLSEGKVDFLQPKLLNSVEEEMVNRGLSEDEVNAIMETEWDKLESLSKNRLAESVAIETGLPLDITTSLLKGDWEKLKTYGQLELIQRVVKTVLNNDLIS
ncbi:MAG: S-layer homology domain-containing protein [Bacillota bacterium]